MWRKHCVLVLLLWYVANYPSPVTGLSTGDKNDTRKIISSPDRKKGETESVSDPVKGDMTGLRKSDGALGDFVILNSSLSGDNTFSRVRRIRRETSTEFLKVQLSSGSYVYRCVNQEYFLIAQLHDFRPLC